MTWQSWFQRSVSSLVLARENRSVTCLFNVVQASMPVPWLGEGLTHHPNASCTPGAGSFGGDEGSDDFKAIGDCSAGNT